MIALIVIAVLAVLFVVLLWVKSGQPENQGASLGHNSPYPELGLRPLADRPPLGSPESLESHDGTDWVGDELERQRRGHHPAPAELPLAGSADRGRRRRRAAGAEPRAAAARRQRDSIRSRMPVRSSPSIEMSMNEGMHTRSIPPGAT